MTTPIQVNATVINSMLVSILRCRVIGRPPQNRKGLVPVRQKRLHAVRNQQTYQNSNRPVITTPSLRQGSIAERYQLPRTNFQHSEYHSIQPAGHSSSGVLLRSESDA